MSNRYRAGCTYRVSSGEFVALIQSTLYAGNLIFEIGGVRYNYTAPDAAVVLDAAGAEFVAPFAVGDVVNGAGEGAAKVVRFHYDSFSLRWSVDLDTGETAYVSHVKVEAAAPLVLTVGHTYRTRDWHIVKLQDSTEDMRRITLYRYAFTINGTSYGLLSDGRRSLRGVETPQDLVEFVAPFAVGDEVCVPGKPTPRRVLKFAKGCGSGRWYAYPEGRHPLSPGVLVSRLCLHRKTVPLSAAQRNARLDAAITAAAAHVRAAVVKEMTEMLNRDAHDAVAKASKKFTSLTFTADTYANLPGGAIATCAEKDPNGIAANAPGAKLDAGKRNAWLVVGAFGPGLDFIRTNPYLSDSDDWRKLLDRAYKASDKHELRTLAHAAYALKGEIGLDGVIAVGEFGAKKYSPDGWRSVPNGVARYRDAAYRHYADYLSGKTIDDGPGGTKCRHIDQILWNLLACLTLHAVEEKKRNAPAEHVNCRCSAKGVNFSTKHYCFRDARLIFPGEGGETVTVKGFSFSPDVSGNTVTDSIASCIFNSADVTPKRETLSACTYRLYTTGPVNAYGGRQTPVEAGYWGYKPFHGAYLRHPGRYAVDFVKPPAECVVTWMRRTAPDGKDTWLQLSEKSTFDRYLVIDAATGKLL